MILSGPRTIWLLIVLPAFFCAAAMQVNYTLVRQACSAQRNTMLYVVTIVALALTVGVALVAYLNWRRAGAQWPGETADVITRTRFISIISVVTSGLFFLVTFAQGIATVYFDPCQR
jgi:Kef-type K+ transport system membrane component KefB